MLTSLQPKIELPTDASIFWDKFHEEANHTKSVCPLLERYLSIIPQGNVLDIGVGDGCNSLFFAKRNFFVEAIDISSQAIKKSEKLLKDYKENVVIKNSDIENYTLEPNKYSLVIASMVLQFTPENQFSQIVNSVIRSLKQNGLFYLSVFSLSEPSFQRLSNNQSVKKIGNNSFFIEEQNRYIQFFTQEKILKECSSLKTVYIDDAFFLDISHGKPHFHGVIKYIGAKK